MSTTRETDLSRAIQQCLKLHNVMCVRVQAGQLQVTQRGRTRWIHCASPGCPDLWTSLSCGTWLEIKAPKGKLTAVQKAWHERARKAGVNVSVVRSISDVLDLIRYHKVGGQ